MGRYLCEEEVEENRSEYTTQFDTILYRKFLGGFTV